MQSIEEKKAILAKYNYPYEEFLKLEDLRGCSIELWSDKDVVEYEEYCSSELLNKRPLVTVWMLTYNQEKYIAEAIEGVVKQQCDFDFELVIVEDHSSDRTLEICKEYQRQYPSIVRLFTPKERKPFFLAHMLRTPKYIDKILRGKYLAFCEGDDYWTDMTKLQQQADALEQHPDIGLCCVNFLYKEEATGIFTPNMQYPKEQYVDYYRGVLRPGWYIPFQTAGVMVRYARYSEMVKNDVLSLFRLQMGDLQLFCNSVYPDGNIIVLPGEQYVYRRCNSGVSYGDVQYQLCIDGFLVKYFFTQKKEQDIEERGYWKYWISVAGYRFQMLLDDADRLFFVERFQEVLEKYCTKFLDNVSMELLQENAIHYYWDSKTRLLGRCLFSSMNRHRIPMLNRKICKSKVLFVLSKIFPYAWVALLWKSWRIMKN